MKHLRRRVITPVVGDSLTHQSFRNECDINQIMSKYKKTGQINHLTKHSGAYGDFTNVGEYQESLNKIILAEEAFSSLPANLRKRFGNDPSNFIEFTLNEDNRSEAEKLGLVTPRDIKKPVSQASGLPNDDDSTTTKGQKVPDAQK